MIFDKNEKRIRELSKDPAKNPERISELQSRGSEWWVQYRDENNVIRAEKCPPEYQDSRESAKAYERKILVSLDDGSYVSKDLRVTTISDLCDYYLDRKRKKAERTGNKGGLNAAETLCKAIKRHLGHFTFDAMRKRPQVLIELFDDFPEKHWSPKYIWNYYKALHAILNLWIKKNLLVVRNPLDAVDCPDPDVRIIDYVPSQRDYETIIITALTEGLPQSGINLIGAVRYSGLRINEVLGWKIPDIVLYPDDNSTPYFFTSISKQCRKCRVAIPMRKELWEILKDQIADRTDGPIWPWKGAPYFLFEIQQGDGTIKRLYDIAGVKVPRPFHDFRKTFKMEMKRMGLSQEVTKSMQGHATDSMDDWYTHFSRVDLERAVAQSWSNSSPQ
jgi:integrase